MIELKNVERSYRAGHTETWVLRRVNLTIHPWEFVTVMGPSGAGKSSLLNVLACSTISGAASSTLPASRCTR